MSPPLPAVFALAGAALGPSLVLALWVVLTGPLDVFERGPDAVVLGLYVASYLLVLFVGGVGWALRGGSGSRWASLGACVAALPLVVLFVDLLSKADSSENQHIVLLAAGGTAFLGTALALPVIVDAALRVTAKSQAPTSEMALSTAVFVSVAATGSLLSWLLLVALEGPEAWSGTIWMASGLCTATALPGLMLMAGPLWRGRPSRSEVAGIVARTGAVSGAAAVAWAGPFFAICFFLFHETGYTEWTVFAKIGGLIGWFGMLAAAAAAAATLLAAVVARAGPAAEGSRWLPFWGMGTALASLPFIAAGGLFVIDALT